MQISAFILRSIYDPGERPRSEDLRSFVKSYWRIFISCRIASTPGASESCVEGIIDIIIVQN